MFFLPHFLSPLLAPLHCFEVKCLPQSKIKALVGMLQNTTFKGISVGAAEV
jgi:hypothetical protein